MAMLINYVLRSHGSPALSLGDSMPAVSPILLHSKAATDIVKDLFAQLKEQNANNAK